MADFHPNPDGEFYTAIPLEVEDCAAIVKVSRAWSPWS